ncbi:MAG: hypothetical protein JWQ23_3688 [Herminiimonas sp.]|nr:hypothetical protein [Herminiimonas sp.]
MDLPVVTFASMSVLPKRSESVNTFGNTVHCFDNLEDDPGKLKICQGIISPCRTN